MKKYSTIAALLAATALTACGSASTIGTSGALNISTTGADAANGAGFAGELASPDDFLGKTITIPLVYAYYNPETEAHDLVVRDFVAVIDEEADFGTGEGITITLDGVPYDPEADGSDVYLSFWEDSEFGGLVNFYGTLASGEYFDGMAVAGLETNPDTIAEMSDTLTYYGYFDGWGNFIAADGSVDDYTSSVGGDVTIEANFGTGMASGVFETDELYAYNEGEDLYPTVTFEFEDAIMGNGFNAELTMSCSEGFTCEGGGEIGGAFFGPGAEDVGGIAALEGTITAGDDTDGAITFEHPSGFYASTDWGAPEELEGPIFPIPEDLEFIED